MVIKKINSILPMDGHSSEVPDVEFPYKLCQKSLPII